MRNRLEGDKLEVVEAIGPFEPPRKYQKRGKSDFSNAKSDLPRPTLKGAEPIAIKSELPPPILKSAKTIEPSEPQPIALATNELIEPSETEASLVAVEAMTPKAKKAGSKSSASKKASISPETVEPKKTKEKVKSSRSKKSMSLVADRLFLGKQLPPGK